MTRRVSRRAFLAGVSCSAAALAGCSSKETVGSLSGPTFDSIVDDVAVGAREVTLQLASSDVTEAVLIGPDGTAFDSQSLEPGVTTVRFPILELDLKLFRSSHYTPGEYEMIVVTEDGEFSKALSLVPELEVTAVEQYRDGDSPAELASLAVTVENIGSGPTWIHDIGFADTLNHSANRPLSENRAIPQIQAPVTADKLILDPNGEQRYLSPSKPLALPEAVSECRGLEHGFTALVGVADGSNLSLNIVATFDGESRSFSFISEGVCTQTSIEWAANSGAR